MLCYDGSQPKAESHSLPQSATSSMSNSFGQTNMSYDSSTILSNNSMASKQDNQNAAALSAEEGIAKLLARTKYTISQEHGQRRYGPPPDWSGETPQRGCEVFIGKIPRDCFEDELIPIFEKIGPIYMFRLMIEFNGTNRGYGFCVYTNREDTKRAVDELNNYEIRKGKTIGVCLSVDNCRLFVGGIPKNKTRSEILAEMQKVTDGVKDVISYPSVTDKTKNRGFAFVEYESHKAAAMARRKLIPGRIQLWGQQIAVDWAEPEREVNEDIMSKVKILYVRNLMLSTSEERLREIFLEAAGSDPQSIERVKKISDYAFIHFKERDIAKRCMEALSGTNIDGSIIEVTWAKPADKGDPVRPQSSRSSKQLMDWSFNNDLTNAGNLFLDPATAMFAGSAPGAPFILPPMANDAVSNVGQLLLPNSSSSSFRLGSSRSGRRNAAGGRSAAAQRERKHPVELLEDICQRNGLEPPVYAALPVDMIEFGSGGKVSLYIGQVTIPSLRIQCHTPKYYHTAEEAKVGAAEAAFFYLHQAHIQLQMALSECPSTTMLATDIIKKDPSNAQVQSSGGSKKKTKSSNKSGSNARRRSEKPHPRQSHHVKNLEETATVSETILTPTEVEWTAPLMAEGGHIAYICGEPAILPPVCSEEGFGVYRKVSNTDSAPEMRAIPAEDPVICSDDRSYTTECDIGSRGDVASVSSPRDNFVPGVECHLATNPAILCPSKCTRYALAPGGLQVSQTPLSTLTPMPQMMSSMCNLPPNEDSQLAVNDVLFEPLMPTTHATQQNMLVPTNYVPTLSRAFSMNNPFASTMANGNCSSGLQPPVVPMLLQQNAPPRNSSFPPLPTTLQCPTGLYPSATGSSTFPQLLPLPGNEGTLPLGQLPNLQLPNPLLDYSAQLFPNRLTTTNFLPCSGVIPAGAVFLDPTSINAAVNAMGTSISPQQCQSPSLGPGGITSHQTGTLKSDLISNANCQNGSSALPPFGHTNGSSKVGNFLPLIQTLPTPLLPPSSTAVCGGSLGVANCTPSLQSPVAPTSLNVLSMPQMKISVPNLTNLGVQSPTSTVLAGKIPDSGSMSQA